MDALFLTPRLETFGWSAFFAEKFAQVAEPGLAPARVAAEFRHVYRLYTGHGELLAEVSGKVRYEAEGRQDFPAVGDWVAIRPRPEEQRATIHAILPRRSKFSRKTAGRATEEQIVAANIDTVFLVMGLDHDFNLRRIERYLIMAWESGAGPVIVLNKADLCGDIEERTLLVEGVAPSVPIHAISALRNQGLEALAHDLRAGRTVALLGSSGVGKSTIINRLAGEEFLPTQEVRAGDNRGRHTTSHRQLILLPGGAMVIDTPGMRELQLWEAPEGLHETFDDIESLAAACRFPDCTHLVEPGCAVQAAAQAGTLSPSRLESFHRMQRELRRLEIRQDALAQWKEKKKLRSLHRIARKHAPRS